MTSLRTKVAVAAVAVMGLGGAYVGATCGCPIPSYPVAGGTTATTTTGGTTTVVVTGGCNIADASGCTNPATPGTYLTWTNPTHPDLGVYANCSVTVPAGQPQPSCFWVNCSTSLLTYAQHVSDALHHQEAVVTGSGWPVHLVFRFSDGQTRGFGALIKMTTGCVGQGTGTIDLVTDITASPTLGGVGEDGDKIDRGAGCPTAQAIADPGHTGAGCPGINIAGNMNCGGHISKAHADAVQLIGGTNIGFYDYQSGDWATNTATCTGDGGGMYINAAVPSVNNGGTCVPATGAFCANFGWPVNLTVQRTRMVTCNHGLSTQVISQSGVVNPANSSGTVRNSVFRAGQLVGYGGAIPTCGATGGAMGKNTGTSVPASYNAAIVNMKTDWPGGTVGSSSTTQTDVRGDNWCQTGCAWSPGFNPTYDSVPY